MTEVAEKLHCFNCRALQPVRVKKVGNVDFHACTVCGLWIRCPQCMHIKSVTDHTCPERAAG